MKWISVEDELPETTDANDGYWEESKDLAVVVKGFKGWTKGRMVKFMSTGDTAWQVSGFSGDIKVTHWLQVPPPQLEEV